MNDHALVDGNTRLEWLAAAVFLELNDASVAAATDDDVDDLVVDVASTATRRRRHRRPPRRARSAETET